MIKFSMNKKYPTISTGIYNGFGSQPATIVAFPIIPNADYSDSFLFLYVNDVKINMNSLVKGFKI